MGVVKVVYLLFKQEDPFCADYLGTEAATIGVPWKKVFLEILQNSPENNCARVSFLIKLQVLVCNFIKKESLAQVFSFEFCEISKNNFFTEHLRTTASSTHREVFYLVQYENLLKQKLRLPLTFFICLHNQLSSIHSIVTY